MSEAVVLTRAQRRALTTWVLSNASESFSLEYRFDRDSIGRQVMIYDGLDILVLAPESTEYAPLLTGTAALIERGVPASVFEGL